MWRGGAPGKLRAMTESTLDPTISASPVLPTDDGYDAARVAWNLAVDQRPAAVLTATTVAEVQAGVAYAAANGLRVAPQTTGHAAGSLGDLSGALLLRTAISGVEIDAEARTARVGSGVLWGEVATAAAPHGLLALHGSSHDVGVVGYTTGGGMSWVARAHGYASDHVTAVEIVIATGELIRATAESQPDLFWAVRGGCGGNFGVITAIEFDLFPIADVYAGMTIWPAAQAEPVLRAWAAWAETAPDSITTAFRFLRPPAMPGVPEPLQDTPVVVIDGASLAHDDEATAHIAPWRSVGEPIIDTWARIPAGGLLDLHMDPPGPVPGRGHGFDVESFDGGAIDAFLAAAQPEVVSPLLSIEFRQLGGALGRLHERGGATRRRNGFGFYGVGIAPFPEAGAAVDARIDAIAEALHPWSSGRFTPNFAERGGDVDRAFDDVDLDRLRAVRRAIDPDGVFHATHRIGA